MHRKLFYSLCCLLMTFCCGAQSFRYTQYTTHNGLPIDNVYAAAQDANGFVWFATDFGISKFDGYRFVNYDKKSGISNTAVVDITYAGGDSLVYCSYPSTLQSIHSNGKINTLCTINGLTIQQVLQHENRFIFFERSTPFFYTYKSGNVAKINADSLLHTVGIIINSIFSLQKNGLALCTNKGLFIVHDNIVTQYLHNTPITFGIHTGTNQLLVAAADGLYKTNSENDFVKLPVAIPQKNRVLNMAEEPDGTIWLRGIAQGVYRLQQHHLQEMSAVLNMTSRNVNEFFCDRAGNVFFCTGGNGVLLKQRSSFLQYQAAEGLSNNKIKALYLQNNRLFIGTENGVCIKNGYQINELPLPNPGNDLKYVYSLTDAGGQPGIGITRAFKYTKAAGAYIQKAIINNIAVTGINGFTALKEGDKNWVVLSANTFVRIVGDSVKKSPVHFNFNLRRFYSVVKIENTYWLGCNKGLLKFNGTSLEKFDSIAGVSAGQVFKILPLKNGSIWLATDNGLFVFENNSWRHIATGKGNAANYCQDIVIDETGTIWGATWDGIFKLTGSNLQHYNTSQGLSSKTCNVILYDSSTQKIYVGTDNGLNEIYRASLLQQTAAEKVFITCTIQDTVAVQTGAVLKSHQNVLSFYFNSPYFANNNDVYYEYKLDNAPWQTAPAPTIALSEIYAGSHTLQVRALQNGTVINTAVSQFTFTIQQKFYKTWWFWLLLLAATQYVIFKLINRYSKNKRLKQQQAQQQQSEFASLKQQAFTSLMNPHFIFNALNSIQFYINKQDRQTANKYLSDFATLVRRSFDAAQKPFVTLDEELETIRLYLQLEKMRFTDKFDYSITLNDAAEEDEWLLPGMVLQPFLENAILHGLAPLNSHGQINIAIKGADNTLYISITDNGIGMQKSKQLHTAKKHNSRGMQLIKERLEILSKKNNRPVQLSITELNPGAENPGTAIQLTVPQEVYESGFGKK